VVAEGVEDAATLDHLVAMGCESAQGFFFSRPVPAAAAWAWAWATRPSAARSQDHGFPGPEVVAGVAFVGGGRQGQCRVETADREAHRRGA
jgi:predicted signal transduction protein with EAL and GGDEF domain